MGLTTRRSRRTAGRIAAVVIAVAGVLSAYDFSTAIGQDSPGRPLRIAFSSLRDRPAFASLYLYDHDGTSQGKLWKALPQTAEKGDTHASLTADGAWCLYTSKQVGGFGPLARLYDVKQNALAADPEFNQNFAARTEVTLSGDGRWIALCAWDQPGQPGGWDVLLWDRKFQRFVDLPGLNSDANEREVAISGDGRWIAFLSDRPGGAGLADLFLYDREVGKLVPLPGVNTAARELNPALNADGSVLAFVSDRPGGSGGKDVYVLDRATGRTTAPEELNSAAHEQTPGFSPDGRFLVFVSERTRGAGERDIYLYDRQRKTLLPTPGLNSTAEDFDPVVSFIDE
ncbi:MAG: hypothetical protein NT069_07515 [Planctomycetota bacterium]|nr:hypothetical protein [Planctomycetota bacterium]